MSIPKMVVDNVIAFELSAILAKAESDSECETPLCETPLVESVFNVLFDLSLLYTPMHALSPSRFIQIIIYSRQKLVPPPNKRDSPF